VEDNDIFSFVAYRRDRRITTWEWLRSFQGVRETAYFAWDDLRPFARVSARFLARSSRWARRAALGGSNSLQTRPPSLPGPGGKPAFSTNVAANVDPIVAAKVHADMSPHAAKDDPPSVEAAKH
ncbi:MAG: hypothetical protein ACRD5L_12145, partial [Bryobacteraceae bacterium]